MKALIATLAILLYILSCSLVRAKYIAFTWEPNTELDLAGYTLYQSGFSGGPYDSIVSIAAGTEYFELGEVDGVYYWVLTTYNLDNVESDYSNQVTNGEPGDGGSCFINLMGANR